MLDIALQYQREAFALDIAFTAETGAITALFGASGAGKTTLINIVAGLTKGAHGHIIIDGETLFDDKAAIDIPTHKRRLGYVFQEGRLFPHLTVQRNLTYGAYRSAGDGPNFDQIVTLLDLAHLLDRRPATLSGGEKQRVAIGRAVLAQPRVLLMDEPLASIDEARRSEILPFIERLRDEIHLTTLYVSHAIDEVIRLADTVVLMDKGRAAAVGSVEALASRLDLQGLFGDGERGAVVSAIYVDYDPAYDLAELEFPGGRLRVPGLKLPQGTTIRTQIRARDLALSLSAPVDTSVLNVFSGNIIEIGDTTGAQVDVRIDVGVPLIARVTRKSFDDLKLQLGQNIHAMVKAVAIDRRSLAIHNVPAEES